MGKDITVFGNHTLDTSSLMGLAQDLALRLNINIDFGYEEDEHYLDLLGLKPSQNNFKLLGRKQQHPSLKTFKLIDEYYLQRQLMSQHGEAILKLERYWSYPPTDEDIQKELLHLKLPEYDLSYEGEEKSQYLKIYKGLYDSSMHYYSRWYGLCDTIKHSPWEEPELFKNLDTYRNEIARQAKLLGGDQAFYIDDQSHVLKLAEGQEFEYSWEALSQYITSITSGRLLEVSRFMTDKNYCQEWLNQQNDPLAFYDDFADLINVNE